MRRFELAEHLRFADHHAVQPGCHAEHVLDGIAVHPVHHVAEHAALAGRIETLGHRGGHVGGDGIRAIEIELRPVARRQHRCRGGARVADEVPEQVAARIAVHGCRLTHRERRIAKAQAGGDHPHPARV